MPAGVSCHFILILQVFQNLQAENVKFEAHTLFVRM